jgi:D-alanyl-D-alanine carboxypeptidase
MRKFFTAGLCGAVLFLCLSCGQKTVARGNAAHAASPTVAPASLETDAPQQMTAVDPEVEKLGEVLSSLSERAKAAIPNGDPKEFLADLHAVLAVEQTFRSDDLSLYYLIDKKHYVGSDYEPKDLMPVKNNDLWNVSRNDLSLRPEAYHALEELSRAALADGIKLMVSSTYRSYSYQERLFARYVAQDGVELAERYSARPGTSQHQLGVAIDFGSITDDWADTKMGKWVYNNAAKYGWSLSFPQGYEDVTGYMWECWHFRYIGVEACEFQKKWFGDIQQFMLEFLYAWENYK